MEIVKPEFSRPVHIHDLDDDERIEEITATEEERSALARRFSLVALDRLSATVRLRRGDDGRAVQVSGRFLADLAQTCVVTLEPMPVHVEDPFAVLFMRDLPDEVGDLDVEGHEAEEIEQLNGDVIDIGEVVAQSLYLSLDPYPRRSGAQYVATGEDGADHAGNRAFSALAHWRERR